MRVRRIFMGMAALGLLSLGGGGLSPAGAETATFHDETVTFADVVPCHDELGFYAITATINAVEHFTGTEESGRFKFVETGTYTASPTNVLLDGNGDPVRNEEGEPIITTPRTGETFSGSYTVQGGGTFGGDRSVWSFTFRAQGTGSEGTTFRIHVNEHITTDGPGDPFDPATPLHVGFHKEHCR